MADAELTAKVKVDSEIPEAMDKAKKATVDFAKQVEDVQKKYSLGFKDIFLSFLAPLALFNSALSAITSAIAKAKQDSADLIDFAAKGESVYLDKGTTEMARAAIRIKAKEKEKEMGKKAKEESAQAYLDAGKDQSTFGDSEANLALKQYLDEGEGKGALEMTRRRAKHALMFTGVNKIASDPEMQDVLERRAKLSNERAVLFGDNPNAKVPEPTDNAKGIFKGPDGFSNVIGVGANPVVEAMTLQLEEARKTNDLLTTIASGNTTSDGWISTASPSRASLPKSK
jgi:hypothetical protein